MVDGDWAQQLDAQIDDARIHYKVWNCVAVQAKRSLKEKEASLVGVRKDVNIAQIVGSSVSTGIGGPLAVGGLIMAPFTAGASLLLSGIGAGVAVAGGLTAAGAGLSEVVIRKNSLGELKNLLSELETLGQNLEAARSSLFLSLLETIKGSARLRLPAADETGQAQKIILLVRLTDLCLASVFKSLNLLGLTDDALAMAARGTSLFSTGARIVFGGVAVALTAVVDLWTIVGSAKNLKEGNRDQLVDRLRDAAAAIEKVQADMERLLAQAERIQQGDAGAALELLEDALACHICAETRPPVACAACRQWAGCEACLRDWLARNDSCPLCREEWPRHGDGRLDIHPEPGYSELLAELGQDDN